MQICRWHAGLRIPCCLLHSSLLDLTAAVQLEWLTGAVARYLKQHVLQEYPAQVHKLCLRYPALGLKTAAFDRNLRLKPQQMAHLAWSLPEEQSVELLRGIGQQAAPALCLELLHAVLADPGIDLTEQEIAAVVGNSPELATVLAVSLLLTIQAARLLG